MATVTTHQRVEGSPQAGAAHGKAARAEAPRSAHADWQPAGNREDPVEILQGQAASRVPELVPIRYGRMLESPFAFFRGGAAIMAADLDGTPSSGLRVQLCGDAHLSNFGVFLAPDRDLVFDINDFDETSPGPWEWDVKRLAASFAVAGRANGFAPVERRRAIHTVVHEYRKAMREFAAMGNLDVWYARLDTAGMIERWQTHASKARVKTFEKNVAKARAKDSHRALSKLCHLVDGEPRIVSDPPLVVPIAELLPADDGRQLTDEIHRLLESYERTLQGDRRHLVDGYRFVDLARKVVGVGSVGTRAWIVLLLGRDEDDPLFLQVKEAQRSVLEPFTGAAGFRTHGQRVVEGQWLMQAASDIFLGWLRVTGIDGERRDFYVRQLWDGKGSAEIELMAPSALAVYGRACGWTLARSHARSGDRVAIAAYLGAGDAFDRAIAEFAETYADQNERDFAALEAAVGRGDVVAERGL